MGNLKDLTKENNRWQNLMDKKVANLKIWKILGKKLGGKNGKFERFNKRK